MKNARISSQQLFCLVAVFNFIAGMLFLPAPMAKAAGPAAWLTVPIGMLPGAVPIAFMLGALAARHPNLGFGDLVERCLGRWLGRISLLPLGALGLFVTSLILRDVMDYAAITILPGTPSFVTGFLLVVPIAYATFAGSEVIARMSLPVLLLALGALLIMALGLVREVEFWRIQPLLGNGLWPIAVGAWPSVGWFAEFLLLAPFVFQLRSPKKALQAMLAGNALATALLMGLVAAGVLVFGAGMVQKFLYPTHSLARQVTIGQFLERLEIGLVTVWLSGMVVKGASVLWASTASLSWAVGVYGKPWMPVLTGAVTLWLATLWKSQITMIYFSSHYWTPYLLPYFLGYPAVLLVGSYLQQWRQKGVGA